MTVKKLIIIYLILVAGCLSKDKLPTTLPPPSPVPNFSGPILQLINESDYDSFVIIYRLGCHDLCLNKGGCCYKNIILSESSSIYKASGLDLRNHEVYWYIKVGELSLSIPQCELVDVGKKVILTEDLKCKIED